MSYSSLQFRGRILHFDAIETYDTSNLEFRHLLSTSDFENKWHLTVKVKVDKMSFDDLRRIGCHAVASVYPSSLIRPLVKLSPDEIDGYRIITVQGQKFKMDPERGCHVVGCGKAVLGMAAELNRYSGVLYSYFVYIYRRFSFHWLYKL